MAAKQHLKTVNGDAGLHSEQDRTRGEKPRRATAPAPAAQGPSSANTQSHRRLVRQEELIECHRKPLKSQH
jgi:hypothetical protein